LARPTSDRRKRNQHNLKTRPNIQQKCKSSKIADQECASLDQSRPLRDVQPSPAVLDMQTLRPCLVDSLRQGDNAYVHCISGITRAPTTAALLSAMLMRIICEQAKRIIDQTRTSACSAREASRCLDKPIVERRLDQTRTPTIFSCSAARQDNTVAHATTIVDGDR
jgi:hypothetical protein